MRPLTPSLRHLIRARRTQAQPTRASAYALAATSGAARALPAPALVASSLGAVPVDTAPVAASSLGAAPLGAAPLGASPLGTAPLAAAPFGAPPLGAAPFGTAPFGAPPLGAAPFGTAPLAAAPLAASPLGATPLGAAPLGAPPLATSPLGASPFAASPLAARALSLAALIVACALCLTFIASAHAQGAPAQEAPAGQAPAAGDDASAARRLNLPSPGNLPNVMVNKEDGRTSVLYPLLRQKVVRLEDGREGLALEFGGNLDGVYVGMQALIELQWDEQKQPSGGSFWWGAMHWTGSGPQSDLFLRGLSLLYGIQPPDAPSQPEQEIRVVAIGSRPGPLSQEIALKAFLQDNSKPDYAEFFLTINLEDKTVALTERDPRYRAAMVKNFFVPE